MDWKICIFQKFGLEREDVDMQEPRFGWVSFYGGCDAGSRRKP